MKEEDNLTDIEALAKACDCEIIKEGFKPLTKEDIQLILGSALSEKIQGKWIKQEKVLSALAWAEKEIGNKLHSLGEPDWNGENHIERIYWKQLNEEIDKVLRKAFGAIKDDEVQNGT